LLFTSNISTSKMLRSVIRLNINNLSKNPAQRHLLVPPQVTNIEARWRDLSPLEQATMTRQLEEAQKYDWSTLSLDEKKASYWIAFGPHGPREPFHAPGNGFKVFTGVVIVLAVSTGLFYLTRHYGHEKPRTLNKEWEEATNEYLKSQNANPITGISSEGYKGKGYVTSA